MDDVDKDELATNLIDLQCVGVGLVVDDEQGERGDVVTSNRPVDNNEE